MNKRTTVHWIIPMPTPYEEVIFRALHESSIMNLLVHYDKEIVSSHPWKTNLRKGHISRIQSPILGIDWFLIREAIFNKRAIFIGGWGRITNIFIIIICMLKNRNYILQTDTLDIFKKRNWLFALGRKKFLQVAFSYAGPAILYAGDKNIAYNRFKVMGAPEKKLTYFPFWVDVDSLKTVNPSSMKNDVKDEFLRFASVGRVQNTLKGHDIAVRALAMVCTKNERMRFEYLISGTGPDVGKLRQLASELGVAEEVKFLGWLEPDDVKSTLQRCDILIHPSPVDEPYGVAVIEAMAAGLVVVASDVTFAALDRIKDGVNGFIYNAGDVLELVEKINWCFRNKDKLHEIGESAQKTANQWPVAKGIEIMKATLMQPDMRS